MGSEGHNAANAIFELHPTSLGFITEGEISPSLKVALGVRGILFGGAAGQDLYVRSWVYQGESSNYFDLAATWAVTDYATLRLGMNNITDEDPPFVAQGVTARENGNTYPGIYDPLGQYWFAGVTVQF